MDQVRPVEAVIPGVQGRVLGVLARGGTELTMRTVAELAGVSVQQASVVLGRLVALGLVHRRDAGSAALVRLVPENDAARAVLALAEGWERCLARLRALAGDITPAPVSLVVFGSFARHQADRESDLDVLAIRPLVAEDDERWTTSLGAWQDAARAVLGNPVNLLEIGAEELGTLSRRGTRSVWSEAAREGLVLVGASLGELGLAA